MKLDCFNTWPSERWTRLAGPIVVVTLLFVAIVIVYLIQIEYLIGQFLAQLSFSASKLEADFTLLDKLGTLEQYRNFQKLDIVFIIIYFFLFVPVITVSRKLGVKSKRLGFVFALFFPMAAFFDVIEDVLLIQILSKPFQIAGWRAIIYSVFAAIKLLLFWSGVIWLAVSSCLRWPRIRNTCRAIWSWIFHPIRR